MIGVVVCYQNRDGGGAFQRQSQSPDVIFHIRARVDDRDVVSSYDRGACAIQRERTGIAGVQKDEALRQDASRRSAASCAASLSATPISAISSSSVNAAFVSESRSIWPKMSSPARIRMTSSDCTSGEQAR